jgi:hypothetical protein
MRKLLFVYLCMIVAGQVSVLAIEPIRSAFDRDFGSNAPNDCLPAAMRVYQSLPGPPTCSWKRLLSARFSNGRTNHVYCVFLLGSQMYAYDNQWGSRKVYPSDKSALSVVRALNFRADEGIYLDEESNLSTPAEGPSSHSKRIEKARPSVKSKSAKSKSGPNRTVSNS